jgi:hypothetical protein
MFPGRAQTPEAITVSTGSSVCQVGTTCLCNDGTAGKHEDDLPLTSPLNPGVAPARTGDAIRTSRNRVTGPGIFSRSIRSRAANGKTWPRRRGSGRLHVRDVIEHACQRVEQKVDLLARDDERR